MKGIGGSYIALLKMFHEKFMLLKPELIPFFYQDIGKLFVRTVSESENEIIKIKIGDICYAIS
jgi:hypothetical protein